MENKIYFIFRNEVFTVYGPWGRPDMAPHLFINSIYNSRKINVFNYGNQSRDFTYIE